jgi:NADH-quinone oxidoreductase subunit N
VLLLVNWNQIDDARAAEFHACLLLIVAGVNLIAAANDLVGLFLALELVSIPTYLFLYLPRRDAASQEATIKYFLLSVFSSALVLYGFSFLYGVTGTTNLAGIYAALGNQNSGEMPAVLLLALVAVIAGLAFRVTAVPFHFYAPDVFQGAPTTGAAMLSFVPKLAGFVALMRILALPPLAETLAPAWTLAEHSRPMLWLLAIATMFVGNVLALVQTNIKRMLAYSSVAHAGYMLVGLFVKDAPGAVSGTEALLFYLAVYGAMTIGVFAVLVAFSRPERPLETLDDVAGLSRTNPAAALLMTVFLFSLTGLPPTAGFLGKLNLFLAAWSEGSTSARWLAAVLAVNAAIGGWYYLRMIAAMYLQAPVRAEARRVEVPAFLAVVLCAGVTVGLFVAPQWLWRTIERIAA